MIPSDPNYMTDEDIERLERPIDEHDWQPVKEEKENEDLPF